MSDTDGRESGIPVLDAAYLIDSRNVPRYREALRHPDFEAEAVVVPMQAAIECAAGSLDPLAVFREIESAFVLRPLDGDIAREAARMAADALVRGRFPGWADVQIAATARYEGMCVLSRNVRDFRDALGVPTWDYTSEPAPPR